ncbi:MAG: hypothetical protein ABI480_08790 [Chitinophagaceae bacterium]
MPVTLDDKMITLSSRITASGAAILKTLAYFDIFQYPLSKAEIKQFLEHPIRESEMDIAFRQLLDNELIFLHQQFYSLQNNPLLATRRIAGNERAMKLLPKAKRIGRFLYRFPFVRAVGVSGSLSKNFADEKADIDFFIITSANRLWIARTIMHLFKKLTFLVGQQHCYCMNYYTDEQALELEDKNIFTAMEVKTLLPVSGEKASQEFFESNKWTNDWLPVCSFRQQESKDPRQTILKRIGEWCWGGRIGGQLDNYLMNITSQRWNRKQEKGMRNEKGLPMGLLTDKHYARSNPGFFQEKVLTLYKSKLEEINVKCRI